MFVLPASGGSRPICGLGVLSRLARDAFDSPGELVEGCHKSSSPPSLELLGGFHKSSLPSSLEARVAALDLPSLAFGLFILPLASLATTSPGLAALELTPRLEGPGRPVGEADLGERAAPMDSHLVSQVNNA